MTMLSFNFEQLTALLNRRVSSLAPEDALQRSSQSCDCADETLSCVPSTERDDHLLVEVLLLWLRQTGCGTLKEFGECLHGNYSYVSRLSPSITITSQEVHSRPGHVSMKMRGRGSAVEAKGDKGPL